MSARCVIKVKIIANEIIESFENYLCEEERSNNTLSSQDAATRVKIATIILRFVKEKIKVTNN